MTDESTSSLLSVSSAHELSDESTESCNENRKQNLATVAILFSINLLNYMDRFTVAGIPELIREFYHIDSKRLGLLQTSFIVSYMSFSPLFGYLGDRWKRKYLIVIGLILWSIVTLISSFIPSDKFWLFLLLRCLVGIGEASYSTLAPTILSDLFAEGSRTIVLGVFYFAVPVGSGLGFVLGSEIAKLFHNWAWALRITPAFGILCVLALVLFHTDPPRGRADGAVNLHPTSWCADILSLSGNRCFLLVSLGFTGSCFVLGALSWFSVDFIESAVNARANNPHEATKHNIALIFGLSTCCAGLLGVLLGSFLGRKLSIHTPKAESYICGSALLASAPFLFFSLLSPHSNLYFCALLIFAAQLFLCLNWALIADMTMAIVIPTRRATATAYQMLLSHSLGDAISPLIIGAIADAQIHSDSLTDHYLGMQRALFLTPFVCILAGFLLLASSWYLVNAKDRVHFIIEASKVGNFEIQESDLNDEVIIPEAPSWMSYSRPTSASPAFA